MDLKPFFERSVCSFLLLLFFGKGRPYKEDRQNLPGNRPGYLIINNYNLVQLALRNCNVVLSIAILCYKS